MASDDRPAVMRIHGGALVWGDRTWTARQVAKQDLNEYDDQALSLKAAPIHNS